MAVITIQNITKQFGGLVAIENLSEFREAYGFVASDDVQRAISLNKIFRPLNDRFKVLQNALASYSFPVGTQIVVVGMTGIGGGIYRSSGYLQHLLGRSDVTGLIGNQASPGDTPLFDRFAPHRKFNTGKYSMAGLTLRPGGAGETFAGARIAFTLGLDPGGRDRVAIELTARGSSPKVVDIAVDAAPAVTLDVDAPRRGRVALGRVTVATNWPLGLWRGWSYVHFPLEGIAYPAPEPGAPALPPGTLAADEATRSGAGDVELAGLREYQRGDPMQRVAWKAVARGGGWYTKEFEGAGGGGPVLLDYAALPRTLDRETRLARLTAWVLACERAGRAYALSLPGLHLSAGLGREHRREALCALALFELPDAAQSTEPRARR